MSRSLFCRQKFLQIMLLWRVVFHIVRFTGLSVDFMVTAVFMGIEFGAIQGVLFPDGTRQEVVGLKQVADRVSSAMLSGLILLNINTYFIKIRVLLINFKI